MTRFELLVVVKIQLADRALFRRCLAVEATMEALAQVRAAAGHAVDAEMWALLGLGCGIDLRLATINPDQAGQLAAELLRAEGMPDALADTVRASRQDPVDTLGDDAAALACGWGLAAAALAAADEDATGLDGLAAADVIARLGAQARGGDVDADRAARALAWLELDPVAAADAVCARLLAVRMDLGR